MCDKSYRYSLASSPTAKILCGHLRYFFSAVIRVFIFYFFGFLGFFGPLGFRGPQLPQLIFYSPPSSLPGFYPLSSFARQTRFLPRFFAKYIALSAELINSSVILPSSG